MSEVIDEDGFQPPKKSRQCHIKDYTPKTKFATVPYIEKDKPHRKEKYSSVPKPSKLDRILTRIDLMQEQLKSYSFYNTILKTLKERLPYTRVLVLGIGSLSTYTISLYQFTFILSLYQDLNLNTNFEFFDPFLNTFDIDIITHFSGVIDVCNKSGKYCLNESTLLYMPHCGVRLCSNMFWANWNSHLIDITYIGNSLDNYSYTSSIKNKDNDPTNTLNILLPYFTEISMNLKECRKDIEIFSAFNNTSVHFIDKEHYETLLHDHILDKRPEESFKQEELISTVSDDLLAYKTMKEKNIKKDE